MILLNDKSIRKIWKNNEWYYVIEDIISTIKDNRNSTESFKNLRTKDAELNKLFGKSILLLTVNHQKLYCTNIEGIFRVIQSVFTEKSEPFKLWMASLAKKRIDELTI